MVYVLQNKQNIHYCCGFLNNFEFSSYNNIDQMLIIESMIEIFELLILALIAYSLIKTLLRKLSKPDYRNTNIWITGASSGIGEYLAYQFSAYGASLILTARNMKELERVKAACANSDQVTVLQLDMTDFEAVEKVALEVIKKLESEGKKLDIVVENAGVSMRCEAKDYDFSNHLSLYNINVNGPVKHIKTIVPHMIKNKLGQIVGITSIQGKLATAYRSSYAASKHAFLGIMDSMRTELYAHNITVTNILPGYIKTNVSRNSYGMNAGQKFGSTDYNIENGMDAAVFAKQAVKAIYRKQNQAAIYNGISMTIGLLLRNVCPDLAFFLLRKNMKNQTKAIKKAQ